MLVVGGDHNAQVGRREEVGRVRGRYGLRDNANETGEDLVEWCQLNGIALAKLLHRWVGSNLIVS